MSLNSENFLLLLDKPAGLYSNTACTIIKRSLNLKKLGFVGTLDPFATGLMIFCANKCTKMAESLLDLPKIYTATLSLGKKTTTADLEGEVVEQAPIPNLSKDMILQVFSGLLGEQMQIPPIYSARKLNGIPFYKYARDGVAVDTSVRQKLITIYGLDLLSFDSETIRFRVKCSKGTYVRTLGETIAEKLGTLGHLVTLNRDAIGDYAIENSNKIEDIRTKSPEEIKIILF